MSAASSAPPAAADKLPVPNATAPASIAELLTSPDYEWSKPENLGPWYDVADSYYSPFLHAFDNASLWTREPRNLPYRESLTTSRPLGWPAPVGRKSTESVAKYVVVDMFAQACAGKSTKDVIAEAKVKLQQIYGA